MALPLPQIQPPHHGLADFVGRHETLRVIMDWIADHLADDDQADTSIDWEDGEEHDEPHGPPTL